LARVLVLFQKKKTTARKEDDDAVQVAGQERPTGVGIVPGNDDLR
jgi:hypothetical protein